MQLTSSPRRALGLLAVSTIGMSTAVLGVTGTASAAEELETLYFSSYEGDAGFVVPEGYCSVDWELQGADGGRGWLVDDEIVDPATGAGRLVVTTGVSATQTFSWVTGEYGVDGDPDGGGAGGAGAPAGAAGDDVLDGDDTLVGGGGGGGGATTVTGPSVSLLAHGGVGGGADVGGAGGGGTANVVTWPGAAVAQNTTLEVGYSSYVSADVQPCIAAPLAPKDVDVTGGNGSLQVSFVPTWNDEPNSSQPDTWEYKLGAGDWTAVTPVREDEYSARLSFPLTGLTNGTSYGVQVRGISEEGLEGAASSVVTGIPYAPIGAPGNVKVTSTYGSITVTWTAPTVAGTFPVAGYGVGLGAGEMGGEACETAADVLTCTITDLYAGTDYSVVVYAIDSAGNAGKASPFLMTGALPFPAAVPASNGPLATSGFSAGAVTPGSTITVSGSGYAAFSTVTVLVYSTPTVLGTVQADATGAFTFTGALPAGLAAGSHTLVAAGYDGDGNARYLTMPITVSGAAAASLASTGFAALPYLGAGALALLAGGGLIVGARRRATA
ncbi:fibronectin type III domain-containing protein [Blastococcus sp. TML/M2B]|uniref:fibronectin type III domain-containing protein n=1 Tax=unclassified Blastococcus TaxID=2619396 RepID=UPI00190BA214|nr:MULTISPECIES: fibronectin type III domain-containing protein [unclassified Blastococcus]MBN1091196.1 fibronectin type III domain-containing protein [Blastococcus sp. TML/M2B]MBN1095250.1 fibronectin type III domain-containing protein [Blastococcus sp. TML/C7B]